MWIDFLKNVEEVEEESATALRNNLFTKVSIFEALAKIANQLAAASVVETATTLFHLFVDTRYIATPTAEIRTIVWIQTLAILGNGTIVGRGFQIV